MAPLRPSSGNDIDKLVKDLARVSQGLYYTMLLVKATFIELVC